MVNKSGLPALSRQYFFKAEKTDNSSIVVPRETCCDCYAISPDSICIRQLAQKTDVLLAVQPKDRHVIRSRFLELHLAIMIVTWMYNKAILKF